MSFGSPQCVGELRVDELCVGELRRAVLMAASSRLDQVPRCAQSESQDGEDGVESTVRDVHRPVGDPQIVVSVDTTLGIGYGCPGAVPHTAGAGLVLARG